MGRQVKRVAAGFDWPRNKVWKGFLNPHPYAPDCPDCENGYSPQAKRFNDEWYGKPTYRDGWVHRLSQTDVDVLVRENRLHDLTHTWTKEDGWKPTGHHPTAAEVNAWSRRGFGHDSINSWLCVKARCEREGFPTQCATCHGHGHVWPSPEAEATYESWEDFEPPAGDWWQLWETVSEGSPVSPAFATPEELASWLAAHEDRPKMDAPRWVEFLTDHGWAPSLMRHDGIVETGVEFVTAKGKP